MATIHQMQRVVRTGKVGRPRLAVLAGETQDEARRRRRRKPHHEKRARKCCAGRYGDPHVAKCLQYRAGAGRGKAGWQQPADRGRYVRRGRYAARLRAGQSVQVCASMFADELEVLDGLVRDLKMNRSNVVRVAIALLAKDKNRGR